jgi:hypothetical protein
MAATALTVLGFGMAVGLAGCSSSNATGSPAQKSAFCDANVAIDKASANVSSNAAFLPVLRAHRAQVDTMKNNLPPGPMGAQFRSLVDSLEQAIAQNSTKPFDTMDNGVVMDTYCGVDGNGNPLPSYFAAGKSTTFCKNFVFVFTEVARANTPAGVLSALVYHKGQVDQLATEVSSLPSSIQAQASATVTAAQTAIQQNSTASLGQSLNNQATNVALYCGQNQ